ncbi:hydroxyethylthiazole kinase [Vibrio rumoiensis]|uniref:Hydroxyethylthiazole kinase n=1 Tax=Vibrio rumoiensis 1S-45 TaxID=1188252 RepID=A0A1E5E6M5_9VIBR|nr:hydroxyethylthiazole kinase [Vibrio rumoiensis]OEF30152.1 hydroxyethylthiazole kinase [Vibrio rumoiensis 1S-45]
MHQLIAKKLEVLRTQKPLVVNITNYVVMNNTANALLAIGASPIMAHSRQEVAELMTFSGSLVINIGTLDSIWIERMRFAIEHANINGKPVILDPVGCGASHLRTQTSREFCELAEKLIIRANASEVMALADIQSQVKGVDSQDSSESAVIAAKTLIERYHANHVVISGKEDFVVGENSVSKFSNGSHLMPKVTGMGCSHTALTGAFAAIDFENAGLCATGLLGVAGELAEKQSQGPGSMQLHLLDQLHLLNSRDIEYTLQCSVSS